MPLTQMDEKVALLVIDLQKGIVGLPVAGIADCGEAQREAGEDVSRGREDGGVGERVGSRAGTDQCADAHERGVAEGLGGVDSGAGSAGWRCVDHEASGWVLSWGRSWMKN